MIIPFSEIDKANLHRGAIYKSNGSKTLSGEILSKLMGVGNQSGFRKKLKENRSEIAYVVLESTGKESDWIDEVNDEKLHVVYFGDNRTVGMNLLDTKQGGNKILQSVFMKINQGNRKEIPPFFYFISDKGRDRKFIGLLVPGSIHVAQINWLEIRVSGTSDKIIENYVSNFTIINTDDISREWLKDLILGKGVESEFSPENWKIWIETGCANI